MGGDDALYLYYSVVSCAFRLDRRHAPSFIPTFSFLPWIFKEFVDLCIFFSLMVTEFFIHFFALNNFSSSMLKFW